MYQPLHTRPVPESEIPILNSYYLKACPTPSDPTMVWGTEGETTMMRDYRQRMNDVSALLV